MRGSREHVCIGKVEREREREREGGRERERERASQKGFQEIARKLSERVARMSGTTAFQ